MTREATIVILLVAIGLMTNVCPAQAPSRSYQHLKFLEPFIGQRQLTETEEGKTQAAGVEVAEWILNRSFVQHVGWGRFEGTPVRYAFVTGWNPKTKKVFQWGAGGNGEIYGFQQRIGTYDPETKTWSAKAEGILSNDAKHTNAVKLTIVDDKTLTLDFTDNTMNDEKTPDVHVVFSPQVDLTTPQFDETPGPGYERLKPIEWLVGDWNVRGKWADGKLHEGEEHSEWVFNKNFIKGDGWWKDRDGKRIDYLYLIAWDPTAKKILMPIISSDGGHDVRTGEYDPQTKTIASRQEGVLGTGEEVSFEQLTRLVDQNAFEWIGTKIQSGNEDLPDLKIRFSRK